MTKPLLSARDKRKLTDICIWGAILVSSVLVLVWALWPTSIPVPVAEDRATTTNTECPPSRGDDVKWVLVFDDDGVVNITSKQWDRVAHTVWGIKVNTDDIKRYQPNVADRIKSVLRVCADGTTWAYTIVDPPDEKNDEPRDSDGLTAQQRADLERTIRRELDKERADTDNNGDPSDEPTPEP